MLASQECDALVAVLGTEALNHAAAVLLSIDCELLPLVRTVVIDHERVDGPGQRPAGTDLNMGQARKSRSVGCHEFLGTGEARKRHRLAATAPEIVAHAFVLTTLVREGVDVFQLDARHSSHSFRSTSTSSPFLNTSTIRPSRAISTRTTSRPAFSTARSARVTSACLNVVLPCPMTSLYGPAATTATRASRALRCSRNSVTQLMNKGSSGARNNSPAERSKPSLSARFCSSEYSCGTFAITSRRSGG